MHALVPGGGFSEVWMEFVASMRYLQPYSKWERFPPLSRHATVLGMRDVCLSARGGAE